MAYFLDTSALFKRYVPERGSEAIDSIIAQGGLCCISSMTVLELISNLQRLHSIDHVLAVEDFRRLLNAFCLDVLDRKLEVVGATPARVSAAFEMLLASYLTPIDALQIATALSLGPEACLVSADKKLNQLARRQGMQVLDPCELNGK